MERVPLTAHDVEMTGGHACAKPPVGSGGQPGADSGGVSQGPILRKVTLPSGALGVTFVKNYIKELHEGSPLLGHVQPGERVVAFTREDGSMIECTGMSDAALAHELKQTVHQSGRIITVVVAGAPAGLSEEQLRFLQSTRNSDTETWRGKQNLSCGNYLVVESTVQPVGSNGKATYVTVVKLGVFCGCCENTQYTMHGEIDEFGNSQDKGTVSDKNSPLFGHFGSRSSSSVVRTVDVAQQIIVYDTTGTMIDGYGGVMPTIGTTTYDHRQQTKTYKQTSPCNETFTMLSRKVGGASPVAAPSAADPMVRR